MIKIIANKTTQNTKVYFMDDNGKEHLMKNVRKLNVDMDAESGIITATMKILPIIFEGTIDMKNVKEQ